LITIASPPPLDLLSAGAGDVELLELGCCGCGCVVFAGGFDPHPANNATDSSDVTPMVNDFFTMSLPPLNWLVGLTKKPNAKTILLMMGQDIPNI